MLPSRPAPDLVSRRGPPFLKPPTVTSHDRVPLNLHPRRASSGVHPKRFQSIEGRRALVLDGMLRVKPQPGKTLEQRSNGDLCLGPGERRAEAVMRPAVKGEMRGARSMSKPCGLECGAGSWPAASSEQVSR